MSILNVNKINPVGGGSTITIAGIASVTNNLTATNISAGSSVTANAFYGSGANLTGIDATKIETGNTKVETVDTGSDGHVKITTEGSERLRIDSNGDINLGNNPTNQYGYRLNIEDSSQILYAQTASSGGTELKLYLDHGNTVANFGTVSTSHLAFVTANTEKLRISSEGYVTNPARPCFDVAKDNGAVSSTNAIVFNVVNVNNGSHYNSSNGRFTAPVTGTYFLYFGGIKNNTNSVIRLKLLKNGTGSYMNSDRELRMDDGDAYGENASMNVIVSLTATDYVQVYVTEGTIYGTDPSYTHFGGYLLS